MRTEKIISIFLVFLVVLVLGIGLSGLPCSSKRNKKFLEENNCTLIGVRVKDRLIFKPYQDGEEIYNPSARIYQCKNGTYIK